MDSIAKSAMNKRNVIWKYPSLYEDRYGACNLLDLDPGLIISTNPSMFSVIGDDSHYQASCSRNQLLMPVMNGLMSFNNIEKLPVLQLGWEDYIDSDYQFIYAVYPIIYSVSCCTFISLITAVIIFTKQYLRSQKPTGLIKLSSLMTCLLLIAIYIFSIVKLYDQHNVGISSGEILVDSIQDSTAFNILDLIIVILLQLSQVQIIMRLFPRQKEKRLTFIVGLLLSISSQAIWSVSTFVAPNSRLGTDPTYDSTMAILPAFVYLLRIAMSVMFSCLFAVYFFNKRQFIFGARVLPLTCFTFIIINSSFAIFIADISNIWVSELSELFNLTSYVVSNFVTWEFINRISILEKAEQKKGILGRQFYDEDDQQFFDSYGNAVDKNKIIRKGKYDLIITSHDKHNSSAVKEDATLKETISKIPNSTFINLDETRHNSKFSRKWHNFSHNFNELTDKLVDASLSVPMHRGSSASSASLYDTEVQKPTVLLDIIKKKFNKTTPNKEDPPPSRIQNVFIYKQKEFKIKQLQKSELKRKSRRRNENQKQTVHRHRQAGFEIQNKNNKVQEEDDDDDDENVDEELIRNQYALQEETILDEGSYDFDDVDDSSGEES